MLNVEPMKKLTALVKIYSMGFANIFIEAQVRRNIESEVSHFSNDELSFEKEDVNVQLSWGDDKARKKYAHCKVIDVSIYNDAIHNPDTNMVVPYPVMDITILDGEDEEIIQLNAYGWSENGENFDWADIAKMGGVKNNFFENDEKEMWFVNNQRFLEGSDWVGGENGTW